MPKKFKPVNQDQMDTVGKCLAQTVSISLQRDFGVEADVQYESGDVNQNPEGPRGTFNLVVTDNTDGNPKALDQDTEQGVQKLVKKITKDFEVKIKGPGQ